MFSLTQHALNVMMHKYQSKKIKIIIISFWTLLPHHLNYKCDLVMSDFQQKRHTIWRFISRTVDQTSQIVFCSASSLDSLPSCNLQRQCTQTRCTTINSIQCLFSCSMWHQNVNWFCLLSYMQTKKKKLIIVETRLQHWSLSYKSGQDGCMQGEN